MTAFFENGLGGAMSHLLMQKRKKGISLFRVHSDGVFLLSSHAAPVYICPSHDVYDR